MTQCVSFIYFTVLSRNNRIAVWLQCSYGSVAAQSINMQRIILNERQYKIMQGVFLIGCHVHDYTCTRHFMTTHVHVMTTHVHVICTRNQTNTLRSMVVVLWFSCGVVTIWLCSAAIQLRLTDCVDTTLVKYFMIYQASTRVTCFYVWHGKVSYTL